MAADVVAGSALRVRAAWAKSRSDIPPLRSTPGGVVDQASQRSRTCEMASCACTPPRASIAAMASTLPECRSGSGHSGTGASASASCTGWIARSDSASPQTRARSTSIARLRSTAAASSPRSAASTASRISTPGTGCILLNRAATDSTYRSSALSMSRQRDTEGPVVARAARAVKSDGAGWMRSGRAVNKVASRSSSRRRRSSASERGAVMAAVSGARPGGGRRR